jgi:hypothetical protein
VIVDKRLRIVVLVLVLTLAGAMIWSRFHGGQNSGLLALALVGLAYGLTATGVIKPPDGVHIPFLTVWPRLSDSIKAGVSFLLIFLWTPIAMQITTDSLLGVAIILVPDGLFLVAALVYLSNGISRNLP